MFLALLIYSISQSSSYKGYTCYGLDAPDVAALTASNLNTTVATTPTTSTNSTSATNSTSTTTTSLPPTQTNVSPIISILVILYGVEMGLTGVIWLFLFRLSNLEVTKFASPGFINRCIGCLSKLIPFVVVMIHYVILLLIVILFIVLFLLRTCYWSNENGKASPDHKVMKDASVFTVIIGLAWLFMHCIAGGCYRRNVTFDAYFYTPAVANKCCRWFLINIGP